MTYYCPFCGKKVYCEDRKYKCSNKDCSHFEEPVFGQHRPLTNTSIVATRCSDLIKYVEPYARTSICYVCTPIMVLLNWITKIILNYIRFLLLSIKEFSLAFAATGPVALTITVIFDEGVLTPTHAVVSILLCVTLAHLVAFCRQ
jgi:hypothetical protein